LSKVTYGVVSFVNDSVDIDALDILYENNIKIIAMRCAGYNNIDFKKAYKKIHIVRVPAYSPYAVAEHATALLLTLNRKIHRAYNRTRDNNFSLNGLTGFDLYRKIVGVVGTGKIGQVFINICKGFGMKVLAYDPYPAQGKDIEYVTLDDLLKKSDIISFHCPLNKSTNHIINQDNLALMKEGVYIINTSRGGLIDSEALLNAIKVQKVGGAGLDVYEEETELFFEDFSNTILQDDILSRLVSMPNVIITSHQAFLTNEALNNIAETTLQNLADFFDGKELFNEVCYQCQNVGCCDKKHLKRCF
jgi:D-lactate dehydrogenase